MGVNRVENDGIDREINEGYTTEGYAPASERYSATKDSFTIGEVVERLRPEFPALSVSKIRYLERRRLINLSRTRGGYRLFSSQDIELLRYILTLQDKEYLPLKVIKKRIEGGGAFIAVSVLVLLPESHPPERRTPLRLLQPQQYPTVTSAWRLRRVDDVSRRGGCGG